MTRVACIGEAMIELSIEDSAAALAVAGDTLNTAVYLKRSAPGLEIDYITRIGDDPFSARIRNFIAGEGIGTSAIGVVPGGTPGLYAISLGAGGERSFTYWRSASAARTLFEDGDVSVLDGYDVIYLSAISLAILAPVARRALRDALAASPARVAFDSNYRPRLWENAATARAVIADFWAITDIPLPSLDDEMALFGETAEAATSRIAALPGLGALKRGAAGPMSIGEEVDQIYPPADRVVDTTAAGDSFNGGYLAARLAGRSQAEALMAGHDLAARVIGHRGAILPR